MQKALQRQLKRSIGVADEAGLAALLTQLQQVAVTSPELQALAEGFPDLLQRIDASYEQYERDLDLRTRSLELSSGELSQANDRLRNELKQRESALAALRQLVHDLLPNAGDDGVVDEDDIAALSQRIGELVIAREEDQRDLANQKFALDQHAIVSITDRDGVIIYANDRFCAISGYRREELIGQNHRLIRSGIHPSDFFAGMWDTITRGEVWQGEVCNRARDGRLYWVNASIVPLLGKDGLPQQYIGIRTDITDRKRMESELSEQLDLVEGLIETIPLPVYMKDHDGRYLRINRAFEIFFASRREQLIGKTLHDLLSPADASLHVDKDEALLAEGGVQTYECVVHSRDGQHHDAIYRKAALTRRSGEIYGLLGVIIDITERKQVEQAMLQAKEAAEAASRAKSDFLANMSHEIRTPMNGIIGMTDLALDTALTEEQREYLGIVKSSSEALLTIINDILDFSKIEAGKLLVEHISFNLPRVVSEAVKTLALRAHEKNLELVCEVANDVPAHVIGDPSRVRQVLLNLLGNAIKFTERGEIGVHIALKLQSGSKVSIQCSVRDTGIGIATDKQQLIFEAFSQEDTSTTRKYGGTGLGLSISRRLVDLMGGQMWLDSRPGEGSTFHFTVDLLLDPNPPAANVYPLDLKNRRILIVDDNTTNRRVLAGMLDAWDIESEPVASAEAALARLRQEEGLAFDGIILDAQMPEVDGYELAYQINHEFPAPPPMLMLSSSAVRGDSQRCQAVGISGLFSKPITAEELLGALCRIFGSPRDAGSLPAPSQLVTRHALRELQRAMDVLLVEDHPTNQKLALGLLDKWGHRAQLAQNGVEAVEAFRRGRFDLILMDMQMPVMGGIEATRRIRALEAERGQARTPILAMTAAAMVDDRNACLAAGMDDYLAKPIKVKEFLEKLLQLGGQTGDGSEAQAFSYGEALAGADREVVEIIAEVFLATWVGDLAAMRSGLAAGDLALVARTAHSLKGTLATFAAEPATRVAADIESRAGNGRPDGLAHELDSLEREISLLTPYLQAVVDEVSG
ncbi:response regulator [Dechloromonas sp. ZY10]|uniref:response regulator n=1 Tax=Dechloromonas aquae TaxID=2664436 RepID=UPI003528ABB0